MDFLTSDRNPADPPFEMTSCLDCGAGYASVGRKRHDHPKILRNSENVLK